MKASDLREKSADDLRELERSLTSDVFQNRLKNFTNRLDDTSSMRKTRRELARVTTILREAELGLHRGAAAGAKAASGEEAPAPDAPPKPLAKAAPKGETAEAKPKKAAAKRAESAPKAKAAKKSEAKKS